MPQLLQSADTWQYRPARFERPRPELVPLAPTVEAPAAAARTIRTGEAVFFEGDAADFVFEIVSGLVRTSKLLADGRRQVTGFLHANQYCGISFHDEYVYTAEAVTPVEVRAYPRAAFERLCSRSPDLAQRLLAMATKELAAAQTRMLLLGRKTAMEKIASFLVEFAEEAETRGGDAEEIHLPMTRTDVGDYLGLTIETVSRTISQLARSRVIRLNGAYRVRILDRDRLEELADGADDARGL